MNKIASSIFISGETVFEMNCLFCSLKQFFQLSALPTLIPTKFTSQTILLTKIRLVWYFSIVLSENFLLYPHSLTEIPNKKPKHCQKNWWKKIAKTSKHYCIDFDIFFNFSFSWNTLYYETCNRNLKLLDSILSSRKHQ